MKKIGLTVGIIAFFTAFTSAQDFSISATYGFKAMGCLWEKSPPIEDCPNGSRRVVVRSLTKLQATTKSILVTVPLDKKVSLALGYQEDTKGFPFLDFGDERQHEALLSYQGFTIGLQLDFFRNKRFICHANSYFTTEINRFFNGQTQEFAKDIDVSWVVGIGADVKLARFLYWTTNTFGETALMSYKRESSGTFTYFPAAFGINSGLKVKF